MEGLALTPSPFYLLCIPPHCKALTIITTFLWTEWQEDWQVGEQQLQGDGKVWIHKMCCCKCSQCRHLSMSLYNTDNSNLCIALHGVPIFTSCLVGNSTEHTAMSVTPQACFKVTEDCILCFLDNGTRCLYIDCWHGEEKAWRCKLEHFKWGQFFGTVFLNQRSKVVDQSNSIHSQWSKIEKIHEHTPSSEIRLWKCNGIA